MNFEDALELRERIQYESQLGGDFDDPDIPRWTSVWVVTQGGDNWFTMYFSGHYDSYCETLVSSHEEWEKESLYWKQQVFNSDGEWANRFAIETKPSPLHAWGIAILNCGHPTHFPLTDEPIECYQCCADGVGWSNDLIPKRKETK